VGVTEGVPAASFPVPDESKGFWLWVDVSEGLEAERDRRDVASMARFHRRSDCSIELRESVASS